MSDRTRVRRTLPLILLLALLAIVAAGCGDDGAAESTGVMQSGETTATAPSGGGAGDQSAPSGKVAAIAATLQVRLTNVGSKAGGGIPVPAGLACTKSIPATCSGTVNCTDGNGLLATGVKPTEREGTTDPELCRWISETPTSVLTQPATDAGQVCTQVYGGAERATVTGMRDTERINVTFSRTNGCEIARWDAASPLWTGVVPAATDGAPHDIDGGTGAAPADTPTSSPAPDLQPEVITDPIR
ncbi:MAG: serine protease inhibitor [Thermoleophilia bacterium]|nr:serine protease inhibitor [Thermoleophilia bacterium]